MAILCIKCKYKKDNTDGTVTFISIIPCKGSLVAERHVKYNINDWEVVKLLYSIHHQILIALITRDLWFVNT